MIIKTTVNDIFPDERDMKLANQIHNRFCETVDDSCTDEIEDLAQLLAETYLEK